MENQERPLQQITCPRCGYRMPLWADPEARARGLWVRCKNRNCRLFFEIKR